MIVFIIGTVFIVLFVLVVVVVTVLVARIYDESDNQNEQDTRNDLPSFANSPLLNDISDEYNNRLTPPSTSVSDSPSSSSSSTCSTKGASSSTSGAESPAPDPRRRHSRRHRRPRKVSTATSASEIITTTTSSSTNQSGRSVAKYLGERLLSRLTHSCGKTPPAGATSATNTSTSPSNGPVERSSSLDRHHGHKHRHSRRALEIRTRSGALVEAPNETEPHGQGQNEHTRGRPVSKSSKRKQMPVSPNDETGASKPPKDATKRQNGRYTGSGGSQKFSKQIVDDLDTRDMHLGGCPLHWCKTRRTLNKLIKMGIPMNSVNTRLESALHVAVRRHRLQVLIGLLCYGAQVDGANEFGETPLIMACKLNNIVMVQLLLVFDANCDHRDHMNRSARHYVAGACQRHENQATASHLILAMLDEMGAKRCSVEQAHLLSGHHTNHGVPLSATGLPLHTSDTSHKMAPLATSNKANDLKKKLFTSCCSGCAPTGTYQGNSYNRWPNYEHESYYNKYMFDELLHRLEIALASHQEEASQSHSESVRVTTSGCPNTTEAHGISTTHTSSSEGEPSAWVRHPQARKSRLLTIDGGGMRGVIVAQVMIEIEKHLPRPFVSYFDWLAGTSVGSFMAIALAQGVSLLDMRRICFDTKDEIFTGSRPYSAAYLERVLKRTLGSQVRMSDIKGVNLAVPTVLADRDPCQLRLFRNYKSSQVLLNEHGFDSPYYKVSSHLMPIAPARGQLLEAAKSVKIATTTTKEPGSASRRRTDELASQQEASSEGSIVNSRKLSATRTSETRPPCQRQQVPGEDTANVSQASLELTSASALLPVLPLELAGQASLHEQDDAGATVSSTSTSASASTSTSTSMSTNTISDSRKEKSNDSAERPFAVLGAKVGPSVGQCERDDAPPTDQTAPSLVIDEDESDPLVWQVVRASGAAPFYFHPYGAYLDGGLIANNPTLDMMSEFYSHKQAHRFLELQQPTNVVRQQRPHEEAHKELRSEKVSPITGSKLSFLSTILASLGAGGGGSGAKQGQPGLRGCDNNGPLEAGEDNHRVCCNHRSVEVVQSRICHFSTSNSSSGQKSDQVSQELPIAKRNKGSQKGEQRSLSQSLNVTMDSQKVDSNELGVVVSLGTGRARVMTRTNGPMDFGTLTSAGLATVFSPGELLRSFKAAREMFKILLSQACQTEDHIVDRAQAWCFATDVAYFRINPPLTTILSIDDKRDEQIINALWQTKLYMRTMEGQTIKLARILQKI